MTYFCGVDNEKIGTMTGKVKLSDGTWVCRPHWKQAGFNTFSDVINAPQKLNIDNFKEIIEKGISGKEYLDNLDSIANNVLFNLDKDALIQKNEIEKLQNALSNDWKSSEKIVIALKGVFKEYLIVTNTYLYIFKTGFMTGHLAGNNHFKMPINNITNVEVNTHFLTGYFEVSAGGMQNLPKNYWSNDPKNDPAKAPNAISLNNTVFDDFQKASDIINELIMKSKSSSLTNVQFPSNMDITKEIRKYKSLLDDGIINEQEFNNKKKQLLGL